MRSRAYGGRVSTAVVLSYAFDWVIIIATAAVGAVFAKLPPNKRPFSITNPEISFPFVTNEKIPTWSLGIIACVAPAAIIMVMCLLLVPGPTVPRSTPKRLIWQRKLWEWHTGWLGLALSLAFSFIITQGMKNLFGKPRPDLLSRCQADFENKDDYVIGGFANISSEFLLYSASICKNPDTPMLNDGFMSYPSGHASFAAGGLIYLSLIIASKLALTIPFLPISMYSSDESRFSAFPSRLQQKKNLEAKGDKDLSMPQSSFQPSGHNDSAVAARNQGAAPPVYLLAFAIVPWFASIYISATRYSDFRHHGFDILFGYGIGLISSVFAFRYYHLPISRGAGWSWGPRSRERSFWAGVGVGNYAGYKDDRTTRESVSITEMDMENGHTERPASNNVGVSESSISAEDGKGIAH
ncbi:hypothetical protein IFR04_003294 [Cadophora malorum]|uniref:Phosphatidic acid phosphatase type 2/haloperoxidase domain-containing protein n=1 Tax=Cadophora malorum TaxID=108018 RepID=A0A8H7WF33_9HELO|nr:hypothetical protein IFR04_003294 [Cadophora malorum]